MGKVGYREGWAEDPERPSWRGDAKRPLAWAAWYPAVAEAQEVSKRLGPPDAPLFVMGAVAEGAAISEARERWPVVLLSHGTGGSAQGLGWLGRRLAARGFVAIGVSHHGNTIAEPYLPEGFLCWWERSADLSAILDFLARDPEIGARLDLGRVFAAGFSLGAHSVLALAGATTSMARFQEWRAASPSRLDGPREFPDLGDHVAPLMAGSETFRRSWERQSLSYRDPRVRAVVALAPAPPVRGFTAESVAAIRTPVLLMAGEADLEAPHAVGAEWLAAQNPGFALELLGADVGHYVFLCEATDEGRAREPTICCDAANVDRRAIHDHAAEAASALFEQVMAG